MKWGDNASKLYYALLQGQFFYRVSPWLLIGSGYQQVWTRESTFSREPQYIPFTDAIFRARFSGWEIQDRNCLQYLIYDSDPAHWLDRNRFRIIAPSMLKHPFFSIFADNEFFWLERHGVNEDRLSSGLMIQWGDHWGGEFFYMARFLKETPD